MLLARRALALVALVAVALTGALQAAPAHAQVNSAPPQAWVLVDATAGRVIDGGEYHTALPVGAMGKLITALTVVERMAPDATATPGPMALAAPPGSVAGETEPTPMQSGQQWQASDLLASIVVGSANDAAYALGETLGGGDAAQWAKIGQTTVDRLGAKDPHVVLDPAGLDGDSSVGGGTVMSAFDMAIVARNVLAVPELAQLATQPSHTFTGPDGQSYTIENSNDLLAALVSSTGLKEGFTDTAKQVALVTAERDGRSLILVMLNVYDPDGYAVQYLEQGFAADPATYAANEELPAPAVNPYAGRLAELNTLLALTKAIGDPDAIAAASTSSTGATTTTASTTTTTSGDAQTASAGADDASEDASDGESGGSGGISWFWILLIVLVGVYVARVMQVRSRRNRRRAKRRQRESMMRRGSLPVVEGEYRAMTRQSVTRPSMPASSHVRVRRLNEPDNPEEPWPDDEW